MSRTVSQRAFQRHREKLMALVEPDSIILVPSAPEKVKSRDVHFLYCPDSNLYYLSGFEEPESLLVLDPDREAGPFVLFCRNKDPAKEQWEGRRYGLEGVIESFGVDDAFAIDDVDEQLPLLLEGKKNIYYPIGGVDEFDQCLLKWLNQVRAKVRNGITAPTRLISIEEIVHELRLVKDEDEIAVMRQAAEKSAQAHRQAMQKCRPGLYEYQLEAEYLQAFRASGCFSPAYSSIVGGGANACILHYTENTDRLTEGDLVLIDAGGEFERYAADITRTFPVNGRFSPQQKMLYELVLDAQIAAISEIKPGNTWNQPHDAAVRVITMGLINIGLLQGELDELIKRQAYLPFYMHKTGHWLGIDVHDVGNYRVDGQWRVLEPGMVMTVEPGLYISSDCESADADLRGIGIRIEDDVVVTAQGCEVLTASVPKTVDEIERLMGANN